LKRQDCKNRRQVAITTDGGEGKLARKDPIKRRVAAKKKGSEQRGACSVSGDRGVHGWRGNAIELKKNISRGVPLSERLRGDWDEQDKVVQLGGDCSSWQRPGRVGYWWDSFSWEERGGSGEPKKANRGKKRRSTSKQGGAVVGGRGRS